MPNYGVIDLGSNSVRLCVYEVKNDTKDSYTKKDFRTLLNNKAMAGLSAHIESGYFTKQGIEHAVDVLKGHNKRLKYFDCIRTDVFATAVLRNAKNATSVIASIEERTGFPIRVLSEQEEAHLGFRGAASDQVLENGTLIDIGGGSTELTQIRESIDLYKASIAHGSLSLYAQEVKAILPKIKELNRMRESISDSLDGLKERSSLEHDVFFGIGGSLRAAAKVYAEVFTPGNRPDTMKLRDYERLIRYSLEYPENFAHLALKAAPDRIHTVIPGSTIAYQLMKECGAHELVLCKNGIREGYLIEHMLLGT
jgi:exopolyphosphatase/guanosine-5'-triphosphate,3'-diphosphate pyrophosphatase